MNRSALLLLASTLLIAAGWAAQSSAKDVSVKGRVTAVAEDGKSITLKAEGGQELTVGVSSKRTKVTKAGGKAAKADLAAGKTVAVVYDDENPGNEARSIDVTE